MKAIVFDLFGVLISKMNYEFLQQEMGLPLEIYYDRWAKYKIGEIDNKQFWKNTKRNAENDFLNKHKLSSSFTDIKNLQGKIKLGLCSNVPLKWGDYFVEKFGFTDIFTPIILSGECELKKPGKEIYQLCIDKLNVPASEIIFIDDLKRNLIPASELGMTTIQYREEGDNDACDKKSEHFEPNFTINSFSALEEIIQQVK